MNVRDPSLAELYVNYALLQKTQVHGDVFGEKAARVVEEKSKAMEEEDDDIPPWLRPSNWNTSTSAATPTSTDATGNSATSGMMMYHFIE